MPNSRPRDRASIPPGSLATAMSSCLHSFSCPWLKPRGPTPLERATDALWPAIDADVLNRQRAISREQIGDVVPHLPIHVVAVGVLKIADLILVVHHRDALLESGERSGDVHLRIDGRS